MKRAWIRRGALIGAVVMMGLVAAPTCSAETALDSLLSMHFKLSAGWALGSTSSAFNPARDRGNEKFDAEPLLALEAMLGEGRVNANVRLILGNFGRLVNQGTTGFEGFTAESSGTSVRRALITDLSLMTCYRRVWHDRGAFGLILLNTGFIFDAEDEKDGEEVLDAASYAFAGPSFVGVFGERADRAYLNADVLVGVSELLTGVEITDFKRHKARIRPRLRFTLDEGPAGLPLSFGFWGDLGFEPRHPDAYTAFISTPLFESPSRKRD